MDGCRVGRACVFFLASSRSDAMIRSSSLSSSWCWVEWKNIYICICAVHVEVNRSITRERQNLHANVEQYVSYVTAREMLEARMFTMMWSLPHVYSWTATATATATSNDSDDGHWKPPAGGQNWNANRPPPSIFFLIFKCRDSEYDGGTKEGISLNTNNSQRNTTPPPPQ